MPVEIREVVIRAELTTRPLSPSTASTQPLTLEMIELIQSVCKNELLQIPEKIRLTKQERFER